MSVFIKKSGFTLLEIMLVVSIMVIIALVSKEFYGTFAMDKTVENTAGVIIFDLRNARDKAMNGQNDGNWGIHFVNSTSDYYQVFFSPTNYADPLKTIETTTYLNTNIKFLSPTEGASTDIIFTKLSGNTSDADIIVSTGQKQETVSVRAQGLIN